MSKKKSSHIGIFCLKLLSKLPLSVLYLVSDFLFVLIFYLVGYRKKVVYNNLRNSFPEKTEKEIRKIRRRFYRHFADLMVEIVKVAGIGEKEFKKRMRIKNPELMNRFFEQGRSVIMITMHYSNWEWTNIFSLFLRHKILAVYKPLHNQQFERYFQNIRSRFDAETVPMTHVLRRLVKANQEKELVAPGLVGDQTPPAFHKHWTIFLNQETLFYPGAAAISRKFNHPVVFIRIDKIRRGYYELTFETLFENPENHSEAEIMKAYVHKMEEIIVAKPEYYLWSHRRWKHKRPADVPLAF